MDKDKFEYDLDRLMNTASASAASAKPSMHAASVDLAAVPPSRERPAQQQPALKRPKVEAGSKGNNSMVQWSKIGRGETSQARQERRRRSKARKTLRDAVQRQWDPRRNSLGYEGIVAKSRTERLVNVDRYIPGDRYAPVYPNPDTAISSHHSSTSFTGPLTPMPPRRCSSKFPFDKLPGKVQDRIISLLVVGTQPIQIDVTWLRPFMHGHCRIPSTTRVVRVGDHSYTVPLDWSELVHDVGLMQHDCLMFTKALEDRGNKTRHLKSPCRGLTTSLLRVSRHVHARAAPIFYGQNSFHFPWGTSAWTQLESFLATIGSSNVCHLRSIQIHVPLWHRGLHEDFVEGALLDLTSPASRLGVVKPAAKDRLLSAIRSSVQALLKANQLQHLSLDLEHGMVTDRWTGRHSNDRQLIAMADAEEHVLRKQQGVELLQRLSKLSSLCDKPQLAIYHPSRSIAKYDLSEFRSRLAGIIREANKYGWQVDQQLKGSRS